MIKNYITDLYNKQPVIFIFIVPSLLILSICVICGIFTGGQTFKDLFNVENESFMDFFNSVIWSYDDPYGKYKDKVIYPPLITAIYKIIGELTVPFMNSDYLAENSAYVLRESTMGIMSLMMYTIITCYTLFLMIRKYLKGKSEVLILIVQILLLFSYPVVYSIERGNCILMTLVTLMFFVLYYESDNKYLRYMSYVSLGFSIGMKIWPAFFILLIIRKKDWPEFIKCVIICSALFFVPFLYTGGNPFILMDAISDYSAWTLSNPSSTSITACIVAIFKNFLGFDGAYTLGQVVTILITVISAIIVVFDKKMDYWKIITILSCNLVIGVGIGSYYQSLYMFIPLLLLINTEKKIDAINVVCVICFITVLLLYPFLIEKTITIMIVLAMLLVLGLKDLIIKNDKKISGLNRN